MSINETTPKPFYKKKWFLIIGGLLILSSIGKTCGKEEENPTKHIETESVRIERENKEIIEKEKYKKEKQLQNARTEAKLILKEILKDPSSYDEIERTASFVKSKKTEIIQVYIKYRAKNSFGGLDIFSDCFDFSLAGDLIKMYKCE